MSAVAYHVTDGPFDFRFGIDAQHAVANFPSEWSRQPWPHATVGHVDDKPTLAENEPTQICVRCGLPLKGL
jgi:hypothetical protein